MILCYKHGKVLYKQSIKTLLSALDIKTIRDPNEPLTANFPRQCEKIFFMLLWLYEHQWNHVAILSNETKKKKKTLNKCINLRKHPALRAGSYSEDISDIRLCGMRPCGWRLQIWKHCDWHVSVSAAVPRLVPQRAERRLLPCAARTARTVSDE